MHRAPEPDHASLVDGDWRRVLWWTYAIAGSLYILSRVDPTPGESATANLLISLAVIASSAPLVWGVSRLGRGHPLRGRLPWPAVYALAVSATALGAAAAWLVGLAFGRSVSVSAALILEITVVGPIWIVLIAGGVVLWQSARTTRRRLAESLREIDSLVESGADVTQALEVMTKRELRHALAELPSPDPADSTTLTARDWQRISDELRSVSGEVVRPLSRELPHSTGAGDRGQRGPVGWVRRIVTREDFNPLLVAAVFTAGAVSARVQDYGWIAGIGLLLGENAVIFAVMLPANAIMRRVRHRAPVFLTAILLLQIIPLFPWPQVLGETDAPTVGERVASVIASVLLIVIASGVGAIRTQSQERIEHLQSLVDEAASTGSREATQIARITRDLASALHGSVQATLVATAFAIEAAVRDGRWEEARRALDSLTTAWEGATIGGPDGAATLAEEIDRVCAPWRAVGEVTIAVADPIGQIAGPAVKGVAAVTEEAVTNAFRHGLAQRVEVSVCGRGGQIIVDVKDDGHGVEDLSQDRWGVGLATIDATTRGCWSIESERGWTRFQAVISDQP